jgi:hypothetical protein
MHFLARWCVDDDSLSYTYCANLVLVSTLAVACTAATQQSLGPSGGKFAGLISSTVNAMIKESAGPSAMAPSVARASGATRDAWVGT